MILVLALVASPGGGAQNGVDDDSLAAALAPVDTAVQAASRVVLQAMREADRDGTPDAAKRIVRQLDEFTRELEHEWVLPDATSHRETVLRVLPFARDVFHAVEHVPGDVETVSRVSYVCFQSDAVLDAYSFGRGLASYERLRAIALTMRATADGAPAEIDATSLLAAAEALDSWLTSHDKLPACVVERPEPFLNAQIIPERTAIRNLPPTYPAPPDPTLAGLLAPNVAWPTARVQVQGVTSAAETVTVVAPDLGVNATVDVRSFSFDYVFTVPRSADLGVTHVVLAAGNLTVELPIRIVHAPAGLTLQGPVVVREGTEVTIIVELLSPTRDVTDTATVDVTGLDEPLTLELRDGFGRFHFTPGNVTRVDVVVSYAGEGFVAPASATHGVTILPPLLPAGSARMQADAPAHFLLILLPLALVVALAVWRVKNRAVPADAPSAVETRPARAATAVPRDAPTAGSLIGLFGVVVVALRSLGLASPDLTAREVAARLRRFGFPADLVVPAFERARYGGEPEKAGVAEGMREWLAQAWGRMIGGGQAK